MDQNHTLIPITTTIDRNFCRTSKIDNMDTETMVEAFKYFNYGQLAKNSFVSIRFRSVIQTHRHKLALLYVRSIYMDFIAGVPPVIKVFDKQLSSEAYNDWIICNKYTKEVPLEDQSNYFLRAFAYCKDKIRNWIIKQTIPNNCQLIASAHYKDPRHRKLSDTTTVFFARAEHNHENWPLFQHFVRLVTDPFIYIEFMRLTYQHALLNSLSRAINPNRRLQCNELYFDHRGNNQKSLAWTKNSVRCNRLWTNGKVDLNQDEALFDFFVTGGHCTFAIDVGSCDISKAVVDFLQKFMDLKNSNESQLVDDIEGYLDGKAVESLKRTYVKFVVKDERHGHITEQIFEFANNDIGKKLQLTTTNRGDHSSDLSIKIDNL